MAKTRKRVKKAHAAHDPKKQNKTQPESAFDKALFRWFAPEFLRYERGIWWFVVGGLLDTALLTYAWFSGSITMMIVFALLPFVLLLEHRKKPKNLEVVVSAYGIQFGEKRIPYSSIRRFWIFHDPPYVDELHLLIDDRWHPELMIPLPGDSTLLRQYLLTQVLEWEGKKRSFLDILIRALKLT